MLQAPAWPATAAPFASKAQTAVSSAAPVASRVVISSNVASHGSYSGPPPTTTGALSTSVLALPIPALLPGPDADKYPPDGRLHGTESAPVTPSGGLGDQWLGTRLPGQSDLAYESVALAPYQECIGLDLFHRGLATFSAQDFEAAGLTAEDREPG